MAKLIELHLRANPVWCKYLAGCQPRIQKDLGPVNTSLSGIVHSAAPCHRGLLGSAHPNMRYLHTIVARVLLLAALVSSLGGCAAEEADARPSRLALPAPPSAKTLMVYDTAADLAVAPVEPASAPHAVTGVSAPAEAVSADTSALAPTVASAPVVESVTVYVTKTGAKYHRGSCQHLRKSRIPMELEDAKKRYGPCWTCKPPG